MSASAGPKGTVQISIPTQGGGRLWRVHWTRGKGPLAAPSDLDLRTGEAVTLGPDGKLARAR